MAGSFKDDHMRDPDICNPVKQCRPFRDVQDAAVAVDLSPAAAVRPHGDRHLRPQCRRSENLNHQAALGLTDAQYLTVLTTQIMALDIYKNVLSNCPGWPPNPAGCTSTNTADGLKASGNQFGLFKREEPSGSSSCSPTAAPMPPPTRGSLDLPRRNSGRPTGSNRSAATQSPARVHLNDARLRSG